MRRLIKGGLCGVLVVLLVVTTVPTAAFAGTGAQDAQQVSSRQISQIKAGESKAQRATAAVEKFADAMSKFMPLGEDVSKLTQFVTRFGGVANIASGVVGILQMTGVIQDPVMTKLGEILDTVKNIETQVEKMDKKLDELNKQLLGSEVKGEIRTRYDRAVDRLGRWQNFVNSYVNPLKDEMEIYEDKVNDGIEDWWNKSSHSGINVLYTTIDDVPTLTYSAQAYSDGKLPATAIDMEKVDVNSSFAVPGNIIPDTAKLGKFVEDISIDDYRDVFNKAMKTAFITAANGKKLQANNAFYTAWNKLSTDAKNKKAEQYANDILNSIVYQIACTEMSKKENNQWVTGVRQKYMHYCENILQDNSGVNAMIQAMTLTHGFEGEIKKDLEDFCDQMVVQAGVYGQFALTCIGQSNRQSEAKKEEVREKYVETIYALSEKADETLTGHDNFCYVTYTTLEQETVKATSTITLVTQRQEKPYGNSFDYFALRDQSATPWLIGTPVMLNEVNAKVLYRQYETLNQGTKSFAEYLNKYGAFKDKDYKGPLLTAVLGSEAFPLSEGIPMKAKRFHDKEYYFGNNDGGDCRVNVGNISKVEDQYFYVHDRLVTNEMNMGNGDVNRVSTARAFYGEAHGRWYYDEPWIFTGEGVSVDTRNTETTGSEYAPRRTYVNTFSRTFHLLKSTAKLDLNGDEDSENPLYAFDRSLFIDGVSNQMTPSYEDNRTNITSVKLSKTKFKYTGKAIKPKVTVKAGKKVLSAKDYTVKYVDNKAVGTATVIVEGKGKYAGMLSNRFSIVTKSGKAATVNTEAKMVAKGKKAMTISWPAIQKADGYDVFFARCNHDGKKNKYKKVKTINSDKVHSYTKTGLKKGASYKAKVRAFAKVKGKKKYISTSPTMHAYAGGGTKHYTNAKSVKVKKTNVTLKKGKTYKIKATVKKLKKNKNLMPAKHMKKLRYMSMDKKIATVTKAGKIKAKAKGKCIIYVFAHNGVGKLVNVTVR